MRGFALAVLVAAQAASPQAPPEQQPIRSGVNAIEVDVRVFDRSHRFVPGLTRDDFEVLENGVPQQLDTVYLVGSPSAPSAATVPADAPATSASPTLPPSSRQTWIFVFDTNHLIPGAGFDRAKKAVEAFLATKFRDGDIGGVLAGGSMVNNKLTSVREELVAAARSVRASSESGRLFFEMTRELPRFQDAWEVIQVSNNDPEALRRAVLRACTDDPDLCRRVDPDLQIREKARRLHVAFEAATRLTLNSINGLSSGLAKIPGPKTIVLLSDGFVTERMETALQQVVGQTARAGARIYAIDVRGLNRGRGAGIIDQVAADDPAAAPPQFDMQADGPNSLAMDTGGLMIRNENNIGRALDAIAADAGVYYVLGYRPVNQEFDGKFRQIEVRVTRPDLRVRARRGYLALPASQLTLPQPVGPPSGNEPGPPAAKPDAAPEPPPLLPVSPLPAPAAGTVVERGSSPGSPARRMRPGGLERARELAGDAPKGADALAARGWAAYERGDAEAAAAAFAEAAKQPDVRPWVLYALGLSQMAMARPSDAAAAWERVRQAASDFPAVYTDLADAYLQLSQDARALDVLRTASARWPADAEFHNAIGVIHVRRGALDEGIDAFARAVSASPEDPLGYFNLGRAYHMRHSRDTRYVASLRRWVSPEGDRKKAIEYYQQYVKMGGPYAAQATEAVQLLEWSKQ